MKRVLLYLFLFSLSLTINAQIEPKRTRIDDSSSTVRQLNLETNLSFPYQEALKRIKLYKKHRYNRHRRYILGKRFDAGSCWFDIKKLDDFRQAINKKLRAIDPEDSVSGFRFYYMLYDDEDTHANGSLSRNVKNIKKIHSLLIVATHLVLRDKACKGCTDKVEMDIIDERKRVAALVSTFQNEGTLCPPQPPKDCGGAIIANSIYP